MMASLFKIWQKPDRKHPLSPGQKEILFKLQEWQREHRLLRVSIMGDNQFYQSVIIGINPEASLFVIDDLFPRYQGSLPLIDQTLKIALRDQGRELYLQCHCLDSTLHEGLPAYQLKIPQHLMQIQRRRGYRAEILGQHNEGILQPVSNSADKVIEVMPCHVKDVSVWGIGLTVDQDVRQKISIGQHFGAQLMIEDLLQATILLEIKNVRYDPLAGQTTLGCTFLSIQQPIKAHLQRKINELQRLQVREMRANQVV